MHRIIEGKVTLVAGGTRAAERRITDGSQPNTWRYVVEVQEAGKSAEATGYR